MRASKSKKDLPVYTRVGRIVMGPPEAQLEVEYHVLPDFCWPDEIVIQRVRLLEPVKDAGLAVLSAMRWGADTGTDKIEDWISANRDWHREVWLDAGAEPISAA